MDTPDLCDFVQTPDKIATNIVQAVVGMHPGPDAILYVVEMGRYTTEDFGAYQRLKAVFDDSITNFIIVLFTGGDRLIGKNITYDFVDHLPSRLSHVLHECGHRYILFNNMARGCTHQVEQLLDLVRKIKKQNQGPYACPKYQKIGQRLEDEVAKRLAVADKKELERQKYVQDLVKRMKEAEERLRVQQQAADEKQREEELKFQQRMKQAHEVVLRETTEATLLRERVERQRQQVMSGLQECRRKQREALEKLEAERGMPDHKWPKEGKYLVRELQEFSEQSKAKTQAPAIIEDLEKARQLGKQQRTDRKQLEQREAEERDPEIPYYREREELKRKDRRYNEEMNRMKDGISQNRAFFQELFD